LHAPRRRRRRGQRRREPRRGGERPLDPRLRHLPRRREAEAAAGDRDPHPDALVAAGVDALHAAAADEQVLPRAPDPARLRVVAARRGRCGGLAQELEWRQPVAPVAPVATVAPVAPVAPAAGVTASRSTMKISVEFGGIVPDFWFL